LVEGDDGECTLPRPLPAPPEKGCSLRTLLWCTKGLGARKVCPPKEEIGLARHPPSRLPLPPLPGVLLLEDDVENHDDDDDDDDDDAVDDDDDDVG